MEQNLRKGTDLVRNQSTIATLDSREVAQMLEVPHYKILRKLDGDRDRKGFIEILSNAQMGVSDYFIKSSYKDLSGKENRCYLFTKMGCEFIANKFTGEKGILFTAKYVERFNEMEKDLIDPFKNISPELKSILMLDKKTLEIDTRVTKLENTMTIDYSQQEELNSLAKQIVVQALGGKDTPAYKELNKKAFSQMWRDFKRILSVNSYKNTAVKDFGLAKEVLTSWKPNRELELMITGANSQIRF